jgi:hypothetical protein
MMDEVVEELDFVQIDKHIANLPFLDRRGGSGRGRECGNDMRRLEAIGLSRPCLKPRLSEEAGHCGAPSDIRPLVFGSLRNLFTVEGLLSLRARELLMSSPRCSGLKCLSRRSRAPKGLVEKEQPRFDGESTSEGNALALAAGKLGWVALLQSRKLHQIE